MKRTWIVFLSLLLVVAVIGGCKTTTKTTITYPDGRTEVTEISKVDAETTANVVTQTMASLQSALKDAEAALVLWQQVQAMNDERDEAKYQRELAQRQEFIAFLQAALDKFAPVVKAQVEGSAARMAEKLGPDVKAQVEKVKLPDPTASK